jgi:iron complex transport system substrate-binding protein
LREFRERLAPAETSENKPRVYFEEWNEPIISGIAWVSELVERAGGQDIFPELRERRSAPERVVTPEQVRSANPDIILASWCGRTVETDIITRRTGWSEINAVRNGRIHEILSEDILQPGFRLVYGYERLKELIAVEVRA